MGNKGNKLAEDDDRDVLEVNLLQPSEAIPVSLDLLKRGAQSICLLSSQEESISSNAVLINWETKYNDLVQGIITHATSSILTSCKIEMVFRPFNKPEEMTIRLDTSRLFTFYCPLSEVIFIKLEGETVQDILSYGCDFINVQKVEKVSNNADVFICDVLQKNHVKIRCGVLKEYYGLDIRHNAVCNSNSTGLPLFSEKGQLIGIQKAVCSPKSTDNLAVSICTLVESHFCQIFSAPVFFADSLITNPVDMSDFEGQMKEKGQVECDIHKPKYTKCNFYVSPASPYVTPIWFIPTCVGWYWTPNDPNHDAVDSNWMPVAVLAVVGGSWNGIIPARKNVTIIRWLSLNNIKLK